MDSVTKIIHVDMDCFYAQIEMRDSPHLRHLPLAIGGLPGTRSVLCTSNYLARTFGVKSAMPTDYALKLCPHLTIITPNFKKYKKESEIIQKIFLKYSSLVEAISLDEAYLDVSQNEDPISLARKIQTEIYKRSGLTASIGLAPNKFLAKIASDWKKPNGFFVIKPNEVDTFVKTLPVKFIPGVGKVNLAELKKLNVETCDDLKMLPLKTLTLVFGKFGTDLFNYSRGIDTRKIENEKERKSLSVENTFLQDIINLNEIEFSLEELLFELILRLKNHINEVPSAKIKKIFIKIKYNDFKQITMEKTLPTDFSQQSFSKKNYLELITQAFLKRNSPIRLLGIGVRFSSKEEKHANQLNFLSTCEV